MSSKTELARYILQTAADAVSYVDEMMEDAPLPIGLEAPARELRATTTDCANHELAVLHGVAAALKMEDVLFVTEADLANRAEELVQRAELAESKLADAESKLRQFEGDSPWRRRAPGLSLSRKEADAIALEFPELVSVFSERCRPAAT